MTRVIRKAPTVLHRQVRREDLALNRQSIEPSGLERFVTFAAIALCGFIAVLFAGQFLRGYLAGTLGL